jgi:hypothetical protein
MVEGSWDVLFISPPGTPPLYSGEGLHLTPPPRHQEAAAKEEEKDGGARAGAGCPPGKP